MTIEQVQHQLALIRKAAMTGDNEQAHGLEKDLWEAVLRYYAAAERGGPATLALTSTEIEFSRWYS